MSNVYYETVTKMEKAGVDPEYVRGWEGGYLHSPRREEQRITDTYTTGYEDGLAQKTDGYAACLCLSPWVKK